MSLFQIFIVLLTFMPLFLQGDCNTNKTIFIPVAKLGPSPSEAGLSKLYNHSGTATATATSTATATARASESKLLDFVGS